ncbi:MAG: hypothetical protein CUN54_08420, partial [Phototrophicales bacterium]
LRSQGSAARLLDPLTEAEQTRWETINYIFAFAAVIIVGVIWRIRRQSEKPMKLTPADELTTSYVASQSVMQGGN